MKKISGWKLDLQPIHKKFEPRISILPTEFKPQQLNSSYGASKLSRTSGQDNDKIMPSGTQINRINPFYLDLTMNSSNITFSQKLVGFRLEDKRILYVDRSRRDDKVDLPSP